MINNNFYIVAGKHKCRDYTEDFLPIKINWRFPHWIVVENDFINSTKSQRLLILILRLSLPDFCESGALIFKFFVTIYSSALAFGFSMTPYPLVKHITTSSWFFHAVLGNPWFVVTFEKVIQILFYYYYYAKPKV